MERIEYLTKTMSRKQKELYAKICELKVFRAIGPVNKTCKILVQFGLIKQCPISNQSDYILDGRPLQIPVIGKLPLKKDVVEEIKEVPQKPWNIINEAIEEKAKPKFRRPAPDHTNLSREDYVNKWLSVAVEPSKRAMVKIKHLNDDQMLYIMQKFEQKTAQQMADHLKIEKFMVKLFCQANNIEPLTPAKKSNYSKRDTYHLVPQKKTA